jgi:hypothetical protein
LPKIWYIQKMTRRDIILQILVEASGRSIIEAESLLAAMMAEELIGGCDLEEVFPAAEALCMLEDFRAELPGIRRWLSEAGLLEASGNA